MSEQNFNELLVKSLLADRRAERRWRFIRWCFWLILIAGALIWGFYPDNSDESSNHPYVSMVTLNGMIMPGSNFSAASVIPLLNKAFGDKNARGVILLINSPGGSPVQSSIIHDKIIQLKNKYHKKVIVVGEDVLASGAYLISTAADKIYVNEDTVTGSVGVIMNGFGFVDILKKVGVTRRVFTAGTNKDRLDPFEPVDPKDQEKMQSVLNEVHQNFIQDVLDGRGNRLQGDTQQLFSGDFWVGRSAVKLGLADGIGDVWSVAKQEFGVEHYQEYAVKNNILDSLFKNALSNVHLGTNTALMPISAELRAN